MTNRRDIVLGFTLIETMVTLSVAAVLAAIAVPNMSSFVKNGRLTTGANDMLHSFQVARSEAIKRQKNVVVCASSDGATCNYGAFSSWIVFEDTNGDWQRTPDEALIENHAALDSSVTAYTNNSGIVSYGATGFALPAGGSGKTPTSSIVLCDSRGNQSAGGTDSTAREVVIDQTGHVRVSKSITEITTAGNCAG
ncbi:MAG TPA: GspH/FimT family pseudopilin [Steroidobacteraceae bacterium]|nr:GspH/FimT family pseudopilin [Steroidobacteraceae bacterium]